MGSVPVPYSGSTAWDNKPDHAGAWPCDAYYGDVDGVWTDNSVNISNTARLANRNVPGDGKFDQNILPSAVELAVGRLDFRRLSTATFGAAPIELLRQYLLKNHLYRTGQFKVPNQALVDDHLGWSNGEAFASDGYRNAYPLTGSSQVVTGDFLTATNPQRYIMGFGAGTFGSYSGATGIGTAANFAADTINVVFASLFGDYFGDWDFESNPLMPALLASKGSVLTCMWSGRPHGLQQGLATGETTGYCLKETQNAQYNDAYGHSYAESAASIALLGDPTLRAQVVAPISNLVAASNCNKVNLRWTASPDSGVLGYIIYRSYNLDGPYERITPDFVTQTSWDDTAPVVDTLFYAVRAMALQVTPGGGAFYNSSTSPIQSVVFVPGTGPTAIGLGGTITCNNPGLTLGTNFSPPNSTWQWLKPDGQPLGGVVATEAGVYTVVVTAPNGCTVAAYATVNIDTILPTLIVPQNVSLNCYNPNFNVVIPDAPSTVAFTFNGAAVTPGTIIPLTANALFTVVASNNGCADTYTVMVMQDFAIPNLAINNNGLVLDCNHPSVTLMANSNAPGATYHWVGNAQQSNEASLQLNDPGVYCCTVTGANGCTASACETITVVGTTFDVQAFYTSDPCADGDKTVQAGASGGTAPYFYTWSNGATDAITMVPASFSGTLLVTVTDNNGCMAQAAIIVAAHLSLIALTNKESTPGAADGNIDLLVTGGQAPLTYQWSNGSTTEDITALGSGIYTVTVTDASGCTTILSIPLITVGGQEPGLNLDIQIQPNPAQQLLSIRVVNPSAEQVTLTLRDIAGRLAATQNGDSSLFFFDTSILSEGIYVLWVETKLGRKGFKVAIAR
jgi:hypothetical protein